MENIEKYIPVCECEGEDFMEIPLESDGTLSTATLSAYFPGVTGLKFRLDSYSPYRALRLYDGKFHAPEGSWAGHKFYCVHPKGDKRKLEETDCKPSKGYHSMSCTDLIVLGLPYQLSETQMREYFVQFGKLVMVQIKRDASGNSKGFGFIRYEDYSSQAKALGQRHYVNNRWVEVKIPASKEGYYSKVPHKIFVGRLTEDISEPDLSKYFSQYGEITDVFIPKPFRAFGFVTFNDASVAQSLCDEDHIVKGVSLHISEANPKSDQNRDKQVSNQQQYMSSVLTNGMLAAALNQVAYQTQPIPYQTHRTYGKVQDWKRRDHTNSEPSNAISLFI
ncbi:TAR DNA-binding protein 43-like isoform X1 [Rhopalosiphum maidis]|uniref:TAR DNA-binding protein 43-like isoform X1 n=1 Tax=Rhopalosiphum maidis TaxID=43146 RepID=UPI000F008D7B|nr:TAR DNA-binding protein 43-like isoform X1 [Rhopalosiphum maidis]